MPAADDTVVTDAEAGEFFADLTNAAALLIAVSGGPDSIALLVLLARWRAGLATAPRLFAATVDHGLRSESYSEASAVAAFATKLGVFHRILSWSGEKPKTGLQEAAREARYRLLAEEADRTGTSLILTGHTLDDQAETVLFRLSRGSGLTGLRGMAHRSSLPGCERKLTLVRPLLTVPKARLIATLGAIGIGFATDPSNTDPRFSRPRLRHLMPTLAAEGLDAARLARLAARARRADAALEAAVDEAAAQLASAPTSGQASVSLPIEDFLRLPAEIGLRLLRRCIARLATEGPAELGKVEALFTSLQAAALQPTARYRRTLAGALITLSSGRLCIDQAPPRLRAAAKLVSKPNGPPAPTVPRSPGRMKNRPIVLA